MKKPTFGIGDTVAYTAAFLRNTGQMTGGAGDRRGRVVGFENLSAARNVSPHLLLARVIWADADYAFLAEQYGQDYADQARENGQLVIAKNLCRVGGAGFAAI